MAKKSQPRSSSTLLSPLPFEAMAWQVPPDKLPSRTIRLLFRHVPDLHCESLREQVHNISGLLVNDLQIPITDAELNSLFGRKGSWSRRIIAGYLHQLSAPYALHSCRPRLVNENLEESMVRFCFTRQHNRAPPTISDVIDFQRVQKVTVGRFWIQNFAQRQNNDCVFRRPRSSKVICTVCHLMISNNTSRI
jgi:hypothetical protein